MRQAITALLASALFGQAPPQSWTDEMRKQHTLPLPDWRPLSNTVTGVTNVEKARFPAIDVHVHLDTRDSARIREVVSLMDKANLERIVHVTGGFGSTLRKAVADAESVAPGRFTVCANPDWSKIDERDFPAQMARLVEYAHRDGARCLKITKVLGLYLKDASGRYVAVNDARLDRMWRRCGELNMPVLIHVADPIAFFRPWDERNESYAALWQHPDWWFHGKDPQGVERFTHEELMQQRDEVIAKHPKTHFVLLHYGSLSHDLGAVARLLDRFPNITVEMGARNWALGTVPNSGRKFAIQYQERILFGTDGTGADPALYRQYFRTLETDDDQIANVLPRSWGPIHGVHLPAEALRNIYRENARRVFRLDAPSTARPPR